MVGWLVGFFFVLFFVGLDFGLWLVWFLSGLAVFFLLVWILVCGWFGLVSVWFGWFFFCWFGFLFVVGLVWFLFGLAVFLGGGLDFGFWLVWFGSVCFVGDLSSFIPNGSLSTSSALHFMSFPNIKMIRVSCYSFT